MSNMVVRTNVLALNSHRNLGMVGKQQANASGRLSSGFRINSAADDAAGLGISEKMRSQIRGLDQASRNGQDGISLIQTAEGAMSTINEMVVRIRELVIQAANDTNAHEDENLAQSDRSRIQDEINQLMDEIDATRNRTQFNTRSLIDGSLAGEVAGGTDYYELNRAAREYMKSSVALDQIKIAGDAAVAAPNSAIDGAQSAVDDASDALQSANDALKSANNALSAAQGNLNQNSIDLAAAQATYLSALANLSAVAGFSHDQVTAAINDMLDQIRLGFLAGIDRVINEVSSSAFSGFAMADVDALIDALDSGAGNSDLRTLYDNLMSLDYTNGVAGTIGDYKQAYADLLTTLVESLSANINGGDFLGALEDLSATPQDIIDNINDSLQNALNGSLGIAAQDAVDKIADPDALKGAQYALGLASAGLAWAQKAYDDTLDSISAAQNSVSIETVNVKLAETMLKSTKDKLDKIIGDVRKKAENEAYGDIEAKFKADWSDVYVIEAASGNELWFQIGANKDQGVRLGIEDVGTKALAMVGMNGQKADEIADFTFDRLRTKPSGNPVHGRGDVDVDGDGKTDGPAYDPDGGVINASGEEIQKFVIAIDEALAHVTGQRSNLGAMQNRLEYTIENLNIASENLSAAESRIRDADMAKEMMRLTQANVLQQAATAMLAQANQAPQSVLQLLG